MKLALLPFAVWFLTFSCQITASAQGGDCVPSPPQSAAEAIKAREFNRKGIELLKSNDIATALEVFNEAVKLFPRDPVSWNNAGAVYSKFRKQPERSIPYLKMAVCLESEFEEAHYSLGTAYFQLRDYDNAEFSLKRAVELKPDHIEAINNLSAVYLARQRYELAYSLLVQARVKAPEHFIVLNNLAVSQYYVNRVGESRKTLEKLAAMNPGNAKVQFNLAIVHLRLKNRDSAIKQLALLKTLDPDRANLLHKHIYAGMVLSLDQR